jgi:hypothetical protein
MTALVPQRMRVQAGHVSIGRKGEARPPRWRVVRFRKRAERRVHEPERYHAAMLWLAAALAQEPTVVEQAPAVPPSVDTMLPGDKSWRSAAVVIGVEDYDQLDDVRLAFNDALLFRDFIEQSQGVTRGRMYYRYNPSDAEMRQALARATARVRKNGTLWIYFAGQGVITEDGEARLLPADATEDDLDSAISLTELEELAARSRASRVVIVIDASFDGSERQEHINPGEPPPLVRWTDRSNPEVVVWLADETGAARNYDAAGHGLFTWLAVGAMQGWADDNGDGNITLVEAQTYVREQSAALGRTQRPTLDPREETHGMLMTFGDLKASPDPLLWSQLSVQDRDGRWEAQLEAHEQTAQKELEVALMAGPEAVEAYVETWENKPIELLWVPPVNAVSQARVLLENPDALGPADPIEPVETVDGEEPVVAMVEPVVVEDTGPQLSSDDCDDLIGMEPDALMGIFSPGRVACVEQRIIDARSQTEKDKLSRLLLANAQSRGDLDEWERLMRRHLDEIDRSDPDLCLLLAIHLSKKGVEHGEEVIAWSDRALENKHIWSGNTHKKRLNTLFKLRAEAAAEIWRDAEQNLIAEPTRENDALTAKWRGKTKDYSREWLDYATASEEPTERALALCVSAAGTYDACTER